MHWEPTGPVSGLRLLGLETWQHQDDLARVVTQGKQVRGMWREKVREAFEHLKTGKEVPFLVLSQKGTRTKRI